MKKYIVIILYLLTSNIYPMTVPNEKMSLLINMINPKILTFTQNNSVDNDTVSIIERILNQLALKMDFLKEENNIENNSTRSLAYEKSIKKVFYTVGLLLPINYFIDHKNFLEEKFGNNANVVHDTFLKSIKQLGTTPEEIAYIWTGNPDDAKKMISIYSDNLRIKSIFFSYFSKKILETHASDFVDGSDIQAAWFLKNPETLQSLKTDNFSHQSTDETFKILLDEQTRSFNVDMYVQPNYDKIEKLASEIKNNKLLTLIAKNAILLNALVAKLNISQNYKECFSYKYNKLKTLIERTQKRFEKLGLMLPVDADNISKQAYVLSNLYAQLNNLSAIANDLIDSLDIDITSLVQE